LQEQFEKELQRGRNRIAVVLEPVQVRELRNSTLTERSLEFKYRGERKKKERQKAAYQQEQKLCPKHSVQMRRTRQQQGQGQGQGMSQMDQKPAVPITTPCMITFVVTNQVSFFLPVLQVAEPLCQRDQKLLVRVLRLLGQVPVPLNIYILNQSKCVLLCA
jgi:hypothetical protein